MKQPNIVFFFADQHRWDFTGYESNGVTHTPALDRLAREGVVFRRAYCPAPLCSPSRQAIASGRHGMNSGSFTNLHQLPPGTPGFVPQFRSAGYRTCAVGKTHMEIHAYDSDLTGEKHRRLMDSLGWDDCTEISANGMLKTGIKCAYTAFLRKHGMFDDVLEFYRKWHYFMDKGRKGDNNWTPHPWPFETRFQESEFVTATALQWLRDRDRSQPFLLHVGFGGPHSPIEPNPVHLARYEGEQETVPFGVEAPSEMVMAGRKGYRAMISQADDGVGRIRELVEEQGELDNTIFVYLADHGEMAGDLGKIGKTSFFEASVHVPFLMSGPGIRAGIDSQALVEILDVGRTLCDLAGVGPHDSDQGRSLVPLLQARTEHHRDTVYSEMGCDKMLFDGRFKLMWGDPALDTRRLGRLHLDKPVTIPASPCRLYDLDSDPHELDDLAQNPAHGQRMTTMMAKLLARINENAQPLPNLSRGEYRPLV